MYSKDGRKSVTQVKFREKFSLILYAEIFIVSTILGIMLNSWLIFGGVLLVLLVFMSIKKLAILESLFFSIGWSVIGWQVGKSFESSSASIILLILALVCASGIHLSAIEWVEDNKC